MKKTILSLAAAALALAACTKDLPVPVPADEQGGGAVSITASLEDTKVSIGSPDNSGKCKTAWEAGDQIAVHTQNGNLVVLKTAKGGTSAVFTGVIPGGDELPEGAVAYYPASIAVAGSSAKINLPTSYASASAAAKGVALRGELDKSSSSISFSHIGAMLKITATRVPDSVTSIVLKGKGIAGDVAVTKSNEIWSAKLGSSVTQVAVANTASERSGGVAEICFPIPVGTLSTFSVYFNAGSEVLTDKTTTSSHSLVRGEYAAMKPFALDLESEFFIIGKFCNWEEGDGVIKMNALSGHKGWYVAKNISADLSQGFKFATSGWAKNYGYDGNKDKWAPPFVFEATYNSSGNNIYPKSTGKNLDVYLYPVEGANGRAAVLNAGDAFDVGKLYFMDEGFDYQKQDSYFLHVWDPSTSTDYTKWQQCLASGRETVGGIPYIVFEVGVEGALYLPSGSYNFILGNTGSSLRWEQRKAAFNFSASTVGIYVCQHAWNRSDAEKSMEGFATFGNLSSPNIDGQPSNYYLVGKFNSEKYWNSPDYQLSWSKGKLAYKKMYLSEGEHQFKFLYMDYVNWNYFNFGASDTSSMAPGDEITLANSGGNVTLTVAAAGNYDFYLDIFSKKVKVLASN